MLSAKTRFDWLDVARGFGIFFVVLGHLKLGPIGTWLYTFHVPLFFFISGYLFSGKKDFAAFIKRKAQTILVPYFFLFIPLIIYGIIKDGINIQTVTRYVISVLVQKRNYTLWFIACLFCQNVIFWFMVKGFKTPVKLMLTSAIAAFLGILYYQYGGGYLPWNIDVCFTAMPFFCMGYLCKLKHAELENALKKRGMGLTVFVLCAIINVVCGALSSRISGHVLDMFGSEYGCAPLSYISAFAGICCTLLFSIRFPMRLVSYVGRNSLVYFAWHQSLAMPAADAILLYLGCVPAGGCGFVASFGYELLRFIAIMLLLTPFTVLLYHTRLKMFLGK